MLVGRAQPNFIRASGDSRKYWVPFLTNFTGKCQTQPEVIATNMQARMLKNVAIGHGFILLGQPSGRHKIIKKPLCQTLRTSPSGWGAKPGCARVGVALCVERVGFYEKFAFVVVLIWDMILLACFTLSSKHMNQATQIEHQGPMFQRNSGWGRAGII